MSLISTIVSQWALAFNPSVVLRAQLAPHFEHAPDPERGITASQHIPRAPRQRDRLDLDQERLVVGSFEITSSEQEISGREKRVQPAS
jgi:hypothetical protein